MMNFLQETRDALKDRGYAPKDVAWIGSDDGSYVTSWNTFTVLANFDYDNGYGSAKIPIDLVIVMRDNVWFERYEYDGAEHWAYKKPPTKASTLQPINRLQHRDDEYWPTVAEMNKENA